MFWGDLEVVWEIRVPAGGSVAEQIIHNGPFGNTNSSTTTYKIFCDHVDLYLNSHPRFP